jgi:hypothetical protein
MKKESSWDRWGIAGQSPINPFEGFSKSEYKPSLKAADLSDMELKDTDDEVSALQKLNTLSQRINQDVNTLASMSNVVPADVVGRFMDSADVITYTSDKIYDDIGGMYAQVEGLKSAERVASMTRAAHGMASKVRADSDLLDTMLVAVDHMAKDGNAVIKMSDEVAANIDTASKKYKSIVNDFNKKFPYAFLPKAVTDVPAQFKDQKEYVKKLKSHIQQNEISKIDGVRNYILSAKQYTKKLAEDLDQAQGDLNNTVDYLSQSEEGADSVCASSTKNKDLKELKECSKSCRTVCRWKEKVQGADCYECPSGSADSCWDIGAWPANHPWCQPGGICHSDPMLYCSPYAATGPNKEPLNCTSCKQRPDMCATKAGGGMTLTNCKLGCWNGSCEFKGKYQEFEWDGTLEWVHCYECKLPPPAPTCESLKWGSTFEDECNKQCPAPGKCVKGNQKIPGAPPANPAPQGQPGGEPAQPGGPSGGSTKTNDGDEPDTDGSRANPPQGTPQQPGGGGSIAGGKQPEQGTQARPQEPNINAPKEPTPPSGPKPQVTDETPPEPPDNEQIQWYKSRLKEIDDIINERQDIITDPREGDFVKSEASRQIESLEKEYDKIAEYLKEEEARELERRRLEAERKAIVEEGERRNAVTRTRWPDPRVELQKIRLKELKDAIDALNARVREISDELDGRTDHLKRLDQEHSLLEREIQHHKDAVEAGGTQERHADERIKDLEAKIKHNRWVKAQLEKSLEETKKQYQSEINELKRNYEKKLYAADERARRKEDTQRIDEYYDLFIEGENITATRNARNAAFEEKFKETESQIQDAKSRGDTSTVERLETELANMKKGQQEWNEHFDRRQENLKNRMYETERRNFQDGVGPSSREDLDRKLKEYGKLLDDQITSTANRITELELAFKEHRIGTSVRRDGSEHVPELDNLKAKLQQLNESKDAILEKQSVMKQGYVLPADIAANLANSTDKFAEGAKNRAEEKTFARLFVESIGEESLHNMRPDIAIKKSTAFAWGVVQGVGSAVKGLVDLGVGAVDLTMEMYLTDLGFDIETDKLDMLNNLFSGVGNNANFDGVIKATVALGGMIDAKITELEKSGDIDWATAEFGGKVATDVAIADVVIGQAFGKAAKLLEGVDEAADAARLGTKVADDLSDTGRAATKVDTTPVKPRDVDTPPARAPDNKPPSRAPPEAKPYDNTRPLPDTGRKPTQLADDVLEGIEETQGFRKDHASRMHEFAQEKDVFLIVRDGNPDSVPFFGDADKVPKPMSSKAKTAKVGPDTGLVVDPTHPKQAKYWDDAIDAAAHKGQTTGDYSELDKLVSARKKAIKSWDDYGDYMLEHGYTVDDGGRVMLKTVEDGKEVLKAVHGDYDLHGVYKKGANGQMEQVSFGSGNKFDEHGVDVEGGLLRRQLNQKLTGGTKDFIQHGGQDDWIPDPKMMASKPADPPVTVFFPDGRAPVHLNDAKAMKTFYENEMGVKWPYPDPQ